VALQWANLIGDPARRVANEEKIALRWGRQDRNAAIDYIWKSPTISAERKPTLVQQIQNGDFPE
jgi:hypothetical protein